MFNLFGSVRCFGKNRLKGQGIRVRDEDCGNLRKRIRNRTGIQRVHTHVINVGKISTEKKPWEEKRSTRTEHDPEGIAQGLIDVYLFFLRVCACSAGPRRKRIC